MAHALKVAHGGSILGPDHKTIYKGGSIIPPGVLSKEQFEEHVKSGYGTPVNDGSAPSADILTPNPPGIAKNPPLSMDEGGTKDKQKPQTIKITTAQKPLVSHPAPAAPSAGQQSTETTPSPWTLDPAQLQGQSLDALNVMIHERSASVASFETIEEAIAFLSQDHKKA